MFRITARTVLELGAELISSDIIAFYELIKNGFDAEARTGTELERRRGVEVHFEIVLPRHPYMKLKERIAAAEAAEEDGEEDEEDLGELKAEIIASFLVNAPEEARSAYAKEVNAATSFAALGRRVAEAQQIFNKIVVSDRGSGMSMEDLQEAFLVIGTASRKKEVEAALRAGAERSPYLGEKGIGRLSAMRLGDRLEVVTATCDDTKINLLHIDWRAFGDMDAMLDQIPIAPELGGDKPAPDWSGTNIIVSGLMEQWTDARVHEMCDHEFARLTDPSEDPASRPRIARTCSLGATPLFSSEGQSHFA